MAKGTRLSLCLAGSSSRRGRSRSSSENAATWSVQRWDAQWRWSWRLSQGDAEKRSGAEESVLARHAPRYVQQCMASSCTDCRVRTCSAIATRANATRANATLATSANATQKTTRTRKINTFLPPSPLHPTPSFPRTSAHSALLCPLKIVLLKI